MKNLLADLHLHTTESDGTWSPKELVHEAAKRGIGIIAITDHDTTAGVAEAVEHAPGGLSVIPGIELSAVSENGQEVHVIGLWIDPGTKTLQEQLAIMREDRYSRTEKILERLASLGVRLDYEDVRKYAQKDVLSRSHIASAMLELGYVQNKQEAFTKYIGVGAPAYVERYKISPEEAVKLIIASKGVPILAHPGLLNNLDFLPQIVEAGLVGMEVVHSSHSTEQVEHFSKLADKWGLLPSGGSDCHGPGGKDLLYLGKFQIPSSWVKNLSMRRG